MFFVVSFRAFVNVGEPRFVAGAGAAFWAFGTVGRTGSSSGPHARFEGHGDDDRVGGFARGGDAVDVGLDVDALELDLVEALEVDLGGGRSGALAPEVPYIFLLTTRACWRE